ncbi:MAG: glycosyltransferase [Bacillota bacterium]|nr:glycosyltransferase [Bacillota bacterium]
MAEAVPFEKSEVPKSGQPLVSLCLIARDEEGRIERCLASAREAVDEVVVVDTGSRDRTAELARAQGARVVGFAWRDDFAAARNFSLEQARGEWALVLDADEELAPGDGPRLRALLASPQYDWYYLDCLTPLAGPEHPEQVQRGRVVRLFRRRLFSYRYPVHEEVTPRPEFFVGVAGREGTAPGRGHAPAGPGDSGLRILHHGYEGGPAAAQEKARRYIELLTRQIAAHPDDAFLHYALATCYNRVGDHAAALRAFQEAHRIQGLYTSKLLLDTAECLRTLGRHQEAWRLVEEGLRQFPDYTDLYFLRGSLALDLGRPDLAEAAFRDCLRCGEAPARYVSACGVGSYLAHFNLGVIAEVLGRRAEAAQHYRAALAAAPNFARAAERLAAVAGPGSG